MGTVSKIAYILVIIGGLNWGLVGALNFNLVDMIFGMGTISMLIYILVGLSALYLVFAKAKRPAMGQMGGQQM